MVINRPPVIVRRAHRRVVRLQLSPLRPLQKPAHIILNLFPGMAAQIGIVPDQHSVFVAQIEGTVFRQGRIIGLKLKIFRKNIEGNDHIVRHALLRRREDRPVVDHVRINVRKYDPALRFLRHPVPFRLSVIVICVSLPGVRRDDPSVHRRIRIHPVLPDHGKHPSEILLKPAFLPFLRPVFFLHQPVQIQRAEGKQRLIYGQIVPLLRGVAGRQRISQLAGVLQKGPSLDRVAVQPQRQKEKIDDHIQPDLSEDPGRPSRRSVFLHVLFLPASPPDAVFINAASNSAALTGRL